MSSGIFLVVVVLCRSSAHARRATDRILPAVAGFRCRAAAVHRSAAGSWPRVGPSSGPGPGPARPALLERLSSRRRRQARFLAVRHEEDINLSEGRRHFKATPLTTRRRLLTDETRPPAYFSDQKNTRSTQPHDYTSDSTVPRRVQMSHTPSMFPKFSDWHVHVKRDL